jgi:nucleoside-diphosphate-sugar epimerase
VIPVIYICTNGTTAKSITVYYVHVQDVARLHVAGLIHPTISKERIFAFAAPYSINEFFEIFAKAVPGYKAREKLAGLDFPLAEIEDRGKAEALLMDMGRSGFVGLKETIIDSVKTRIDVSS